MTLSIFAALTVLAILFFYHYRPYWAWVIPGAAAIGWWPLRVTVYSHGFSGGRSAYAHS